MKNEQNMGAPKRYAINIGLSKTNEDHYDISLPLESGPLVANYLNKFFKDRKFDDLSNGDWINEKATKERLKIRLSELQSELESGDLLVLSFCGHTISIPKDVNYSKNQDEGWALYDEIFFHFEFWRFAQGFKPGVKIIVISDSCFSGAMEAQFIYDKSKNLMTFWERHEYLYKEILRGSGFPMQHAVPPSVVIISASAEDEVAQEMRGRDKRTYFSEAFEKSWEKIASRRGLSNFFDVQSTTLQSILKGRYSFYAQWHYYQGHSSTKLRSSPPFK